MRICRLAIIGAHLGLAGCVIGYGPCLFQANDVQLVGIAEFPQNVIENSHVNVDGRLFQAGSSREHTPFLMNVITILPLPDSH